MTTFATRRIPAASRREAMDWSLVLASQGIDTVIDQPAEEPGWGLLVDPRDHDLAVDALRQYTFENRHWRWQQPLPWQGLLFDWAAVVWSLVLVAFYWLSYAYAPSLLSAGIMDITAVRSGEWWRLFTAIMLHADLGHLATNATTAILLLGLTMGRYGTGVGLLASLLAGVGGNVAGVLIYPEPFRGLGASGMILGALGLLTAQGIAAVWHDRKSVRGLLAAMAGGFMLFLLLGSTPGTDLVAHLGGFVSGLVLGAVLCLLPRTFLRDPKCNLTAGLIAALLIVVTCRLALNAGTLFS